MCDYSLHDVASRPARVGDKLVSTRFQGTSTRGFAAETERDVAVCPSGPAQGMVCGSLREPEQVVAEQVELLVLREPGGEEGSLLLGREGRGDDGREPIVFQLAETAADEADRGRGRVGHRREKRGVRVAAPWPRPRSLATPSDEAGRGGYAPGGGGRGHVDRG